MKQSIFFYGVVFLVCIGLSYRVFESFSVSGDIDNGWIQGIWSSVFREKPYVIQVTSDPLSIPTATYVPTRQPCLYPPCPAPDVYQLSYAN
jgi:hypothetical protein